MYVYRFPRRLSGKESICDWRDAGYPGLILGSGRSAGERNENPLLGNPMDRGAWQATVHGVSEELDMT